MTLREHFEHLLRVENDFIGRSSSNLKRDGDNWHDPRTADIWEWFEKGYRLRSDIEYITTKLELPTMEEE